MISKIGWVAISLLISVFAINTAFASYAECANGNDPKKGPPWDPCRYFESKDVPSTKQDAEKFMQQVPAIMKKMQQEPLNINKLEQLGFLGNPSEQQQNGTAMEFLMWEAGYKKPTISAGGTGIFSVNSFYDGAYGYNFKYLLLPFKYTQGWLRCQGLNFTPNAGEILKAKEIIDNFNRFINRLLTPYKSIPADQETAQEMSARQTAFNDETLSIVKGFHYDDYMAYARSQLSLYTIAQSAIKPFSKHYLNLGCLREKQGKITIHKP